MFFFKKKPKSRAIYAINTGLFKGEFFVYVDIIKDPDLYCFLSVPKNICRWVPKKSFDVGLKQKIISLVEVLPKNVYQSCLTQYNSTLEKPLNKAEKK